MTGRPDDLIAYEAEWAFARELGYVCETCDHWHRELPADPFAPASDQLRPACQACGAQTIALYRLTDADELERVAPYPREPHA